MEDIFWPETYKNPRVQADISKGYVLICGRSIPEHAEKFYEPLLKWIQEYLAMKKPITIDFKLIYLNTNSWRNFLVLLQMIEKAGIIYTINWFYEEDDTDILQAGKDLSKLSGLNFNFVEIEETGCLSFHS